MKDTNIITISGDALTSDVADTIAKIEQAWKNSSEPQNDIFLLSQVIAIADVDLDSFIEARRVITEHYANIGENIPEDVHGRKRTRVRRAAAIRNSVTSFWAKSKPHHDKIPLWTEKLGEVQMEGLDIVEARLISPKFIISRLIGWSRSDLVTAARNELIETYLMKIDEIS